MQLFEAGVAEMGKKRKERSTRFCTLEVMTQNPDLKYCK